MYKLVKIPKLQSNYIIQYVQVVPCNEEKISL